MAGWSRARTKPRANPKITPNDIPLTRVAAAAAGSALSTIPRTLETGDENVFFRRLAICVCGAHTLGPLWHFARRSWLDEAAVRERAKKKTSLEETIVSGRAVMMFISATSAPFFEEE